MMNDNTAITTTTTTTTTRTAPIGPYGRVCILYEPTADLKWDNSWWPVCNLVRPTNLR